MPQRAQETTPSVREQLASLEDHIRRRMEELAPLAAEYHELEQIALRLGLVDAPRRAPRDGDRGRANGRAGAGERHDQLLTLIRRRPGITVREAATVLDVDP